MSCSATFVSLMLLCRLTLYGQSAAQFAEHISDLNMDFSTSMTVSEQTPPSVESAPVEPNPEPIPTPTPAPEAPLHLIPPGMSTPVQVSPDEQRLVALYQSITVYLNEQVYLMGEYTDHPTKVIGFVPSSFDGWSTEAQDAFLTWCADHFQVAVCVATMDQLLATQPEDPNAYEGWYALKGSTSVHMEVIEWESDTRARVGFSESSSLLGYNGFLDYIFEQQTDGKWTLTEEGVRVAS